MKLSKGEREGTEDSGVHPEPQEIGKLSRERRPWACSILALVLPNAKEEMARLENRAPLLEHKSQDPAARLPG